MSTIKSDKVTLKKIGIIWFRNDLRLNDNLVLNEAINQINKKKIDLIIPFYCFDKSILDGKSRVGKLPRCGPQRRNFLIESVENLMKNLQEKLKSNLYISYGKPAEELVRLIDLITQNDNKIMIKFIFAQEETSSEEIDLELELKSLISNRKITLNLIWDVTLIHKDDLPYDDVKEFPDIYALFRKKVEANWCVRSPVVLPRNFSLPTYSLLNWNHNAMPSKSNYPKSMRSAILNMYGGEDEALKRLAFYFYQSNGLKDYAHTRNGLLGTEYSSKFSIWMAIGCISARYIYAELKHYERSHGVSASTEKFRLEILWRDRFKFHSLKVGKNMFFLYAGNELLGKTFDWIKDTNLFQKWIDGETGYPLVDANMKELAETGWMSNRGRQNVASFLTKDLKIDWRLGAEYFEMMLIDYDVASNWINWQHIAGVSGTDPREDRYFNVIKQAYDYDPNGDYARLWLPQLTNVPNNYIYCPFKLSFGDQARYKCKEYPQPLVDIRTDWNPLKRVSVVRNTSEKPKRIEF